MLPCKTNKTNKNKGVTPVFIGSQCKEAINERALSQKKN